MEAASRAMMKLVVISNEKTMYSVCENISTNSPDLLKKRGAPDTMSPREQKLSAMRDTRDRRAAKKEKTSSLTPGNKGDAYDIDSVLESLGEKKTEEKQQKKTRKKGTDKNDKQLAEDPVPSGRVKTTQSPMAPAAGIVQTTPEPDTKPKSVLEPNESSSTSSALQFCSALVGHILHDVFFITENDGFSVPAERLELVRLDNEIRPGARTQVFGLNLPGQSQHRIVGYVHSALVPLPDHSESDGYRTPYTVLNDVSILVDKILFKHYHRYFGWSVSNKLYLVAYQGAIFQEQSSTRPEPEGRGFSADEEVKQILLGLLTHWMEEATEEDASTNMDHLLQVPDGMASIRDIYAATDPLYLEETVAATSPGAESGASSSDGQLPCCSGA